jgi:hypothetical protein
VVFKFPISQVLTQLWYHYTVFQVFHTKTNQLLVIVSDLFQFEVFRFPELPDLVQWLEEIVGVFAQAVELIV